MPAQVIIWLPMPGSRSVGHAALAVKTLNGKNAYISWYPQNANTQSSIFGNNFTVKGAFNINRFSDDLQRNVSEDAAKRAKLNAKPEMGQFHIPDLEVNQGKGKIAKIPQRIITLPGEGEEGHSFGLNLDNMILWWEAITAIKHINGTMGEFKLYSKDRNCASVVIAALRIAGGSLFGSKVKSVVANKPMDAAIYADHILLGINNANTTRKKIINKTSVSNKKWFEDKKDAENRSNKNSDESSLANIPVDGSGLMTLKQWVNLSYDGLFSIRKDQIKGIDSALERFHDIKKRADADLGAMLQFAGDHLRLKPGSNRRNAVLYFATHLIDYLSNDNNKKTKYTTSVSQIKNQANLFANGMPLERIEAWKLADKNVLVASKAPPKR